MSTKKRPARGRPTAEMARKRHEQLLDLSIKMFIRDGFAATSMTAIAESLGMTKRTVYALYENKEALFKASVRRALDNMSVPYEAYAELETDALERTLLAIARKRVDMYMGSDARQVQQLIDAEKQRFPELVALNFRQNPAPVREYLIDLFKRARKNGEIRLKSPEMTAEIFLGMTVGSTVSAVSTGMIENKPAAIQRNIKWALEIFMRGVQPD